jgi:hypothetical protein
MGMSDLGYGFNILRTRSPISRPRLKRETTPHRRASRWPSAPTHSQKLPIADGMRPKRVGDRAFDVDPDFLRSHVLAVPIS